MTSFFAFIASAAGRITRIAAGAVLIAVGVLLGGGWWALAVVGLVPYLHKELLPQGHSKATKGSRRSRRPSCRPGRDTQGGI